jgi:hypothetical protein
MVDVTNLKVGVPQVRNVGVGPVAGGRLPIPTVAVLADDHLDAQDVVPGSTTGAVSPAPDVDIQP